MEDKLKLEIATLVAGIFDQKKEEDQRAKTKQALEAAATSVEDLNSKVEEAQASIDTLTTEKSTIEAELVTFKETSEKDKKELDTQVATAKTEKEAAEAKLLEVSTELEDLKQEAVASTRLADLETEGVLREDSESQKAKVKSMSDEEFASYKEELVSIKASIVTKLKEEADAKVAADAAAGEGDDKEKASGEGDSKDELNTPPANIPDTKAVASALNMELRPSDDIMSQYQAMGSAMAEEIEKGGK